MGSLHAVAIQPLPQSTSSFETLIAALKTRTMFTVMRTVLKQEKLPMGQGWADVTANASENTPQGDVFRSFLKRYFDESIITGDRYVQLYQVANEVTEKILAQTKKVVANSPTFGSAYPIPLAQNFLSSAPSDPELCEVRNHANGDLSLILCSARWHDDKSAYEAKQLPKHVLDTYKGIDKLVTYRKIYYQAYDVVTLRTKLNRIEVCIDSPAKARSSEIDVLPLKLLSICALHISGFIDIGTKSPENLFPAISGMYYKSTEGKVTALSFRTLTGSIKKERMTPESEDLRDEKFHYAGMNALGQKISPYELILEYEARLPRETTTLKLSALIRELSSASPTLNGCYVTSNSYAAFEQTLNRLVTYLV